MIPARHPEAHRIDRAARRSARETIDRVRHRARIRGGGSVGGGGGGPGEDTLIAAFTRVNGSASAATGSDQIIGHPLKKFALSAGDILVLTDENDAEIDARFRYLRPYDEDSDTPAFVHIMPRHDDIAASGNLPLKLKKRAGSYADTDPETDIEALLDAHDFKLEITDLTASAYTFTSVSGSDAETTFTQFFATGYDLVVEVTSQSTGSDILVEGVDYTVSNGSGATVDGQTGYSSITITLASPPADSYVIEITPSWPYLTGTATFNFADAYDATRARKLIANDICERWSWHDYLGSHLLVNPYLTHWLNANGTTKKVYPTAVVSLQEWAVAGKFRLDYTATLKDGSETLATYTDVVHPYMSQWATVRPNADIAIARPIASDGTSNTTHTIYDKEYLSACECLVPFNTEAVPDEYTLLPWLSPGESDGDAGQTHLGFNCFVDQGGGSNARAALPSKNDMHAVMLQTANAWAVSRLAALTSLHIPYHARPPLGSGPNMMLTFSMDDGDGVVHAENSWSGMPAGLAYPSRHAQNHSYVRPLGGTGDWAVSENTSHASPLGLFMGWLIEGEDIHLQAGLDLLTNTVHQASILDQQPTLPFATFTGYSGIPTSTWAGVGQSWSGQERSSGHFAHILKLAAGFVPADCTERPFTDALLAHVGNYFATGIPLLPAGHIANGNYGGSGSDGYVQSTYHQEMNSYHFSRLAALTGNAGHEAIANMLGNLTVGFCAGNRGRCAQDRYSQFPKSDSYNASTNPHQPAANPLIIHNASVSGNVITISNSEALAPMLNPNDPFVFLDMDNNYNARAIPSGATAGTFYYVRNDINLLTPYSASFTASDAPGGGTKTLGNTSPIALGIDHVGSDANTPDDMGSADSFLMIHFAALRSQEVYGFAAATQEVSDRYEEYINTASSSPIDFAADAAWDLRRAA